MSPHNKLMPVDRTGITTTAHILPEFLFDPEGYAIRHGLPLRGIHPLKVPDKVFGRHRNAFRFYPTTFRGIEVTVIPVDLSTGWCDLLIKFNPGATLYGHNGRVPSESEFCDALSFLAEAMCPFLVDPGDWRCIVPGLRPDSPASWNFIEILFHCHDRDGLILDHFRNAAHPSIRRPARHWTTSILLPGCELQFSIYQKTVEMAARGKLSKDELQNFADILRIEVRLKGKKLLHYLGNSGNTSLIDGTERVVRFRGPDLIRAFRDLLGETQGVFHLSEANMISGKQIASLGQFIAKVSRMPGVRQNFHELLDSLCAHFRASGNTRRRIRKEGLAWLAARSFLTPAALLSDAAMACQPLVVADQIESLVRNPVPGNDILDAVRQVFSSPQLELHPHVQLHNYFRYANEEQAPAA